jgi:hypothetical protein
MWFYCFISLRSDATVRTACRDDEVKLALRVIFLVAIFVICKPPYCSVFLRMFFSSVRATKMKNRSMLLKTQNHLDTATASKDAIRVSSKIFCLYVNDLESNLIIFIKSTVK